MNRVETVKILTILASNYKFFNEQMSEAGKSDVLVGTWHSCFEDMSYDLVSNAVKKCILINKYPPTVHDVRTYASEIVNPNTHKTSIEAWNEAYKMICDSGYMTQEEFEKASPEIQKFFGNVRQVKEIGQSDIKIVNTVVKGQFLKQYETIVERQTQEKLIPISTLNKLKLLQKNIQGVE